MRVLIVDHNCVLKNAQKKVEALAKFGDLEISLLVPPKNLEPQGMVDLEKRHDDRYGIVVGRSRLDMVLNQRYLQHYSDARRILEEAKPDLIDLKEEPWGAMAWQIVRLAETVAPRSRIVFETEQNIFKTYPPPFRGFEGRVHRRSHAAIARNAEAAEVLRRKGYEKEIAVIPNGVDLERFRPVDSAELRARLGLDGHVVGFLGRLEKQKGLDSLIEAAAGIDPPPTLFFLGSGKDERSFRDRARRLGVRAVFHPPVPHLETPAFLCAMDVMVLPSLTMSNWKEQFGRTLIEAMACGVPVAGSSSGAIPETVGDAGLIFPEGDARAIRECIVRIRDDAPLRAALIEKGKARARARFDWPAIARQMKTLFDRVAGMG